MGGWVAGKGGRIKVFVQNSEPAVLGDSIFIAYLLTFVCD